MFTHAPYFPFEFICLLFPLWLIYHSVFRKRWGKNLHSIKCTMIQLQVSQRKALNCTVVIRTGGKTSKQWCIWIKRKQWISLLCREPTQALYINCTLVEIESEISWRGYVVYKLCTSFYTQLRVSPLQFLPLKRVDPSLWKPRILPAWWGWRVPSLAGICTERQGRKRRAAESTSEICWKTWAAWG